MIETIYIHYNGQIDCAVKIQCPENAPQEDKEKAALLILKKTMLLDVTKTAQ